MAALHAAVGAPIGPSCRAVEGQGDALTSLLGETLRSLFRYNTGRLSADELGLPASNTPDPRVTVLVIDSQPHDQTLRPRSGHGRHMGNIIADIACPDEDPNCRVEVEFVVGLPRIAGGGVDYHRGGVVGTHADLAAAIYEGIERWEQANATRTVPTRLVLNLSVGWELAIFGDEPSLAPAIGAVRTALELASCKGALIVASAGNEGDYCNVTGAMAPAVWEAHPAPGVTRCGELGVVIPAPGNGYRPLVNAVGGLDLERNPLADARVAADPRLMAAAEHVAAGEPLYGGLTGTSVATAVTSAAAALVWSHRPNLPAAGVIGWVYAGGEPLVDVTTDFGLAGDLMPPRRVDACAALLAACAAPGATCPALPLSCLVADPPAKGDLAIELDEVLPDEVLELSLPDVDQCVDACGATVDVRVRAGESASCDAFAVDPAEAMVNPTPDSIGCPTCTIKNGMLMLSTHSSFDGVGIVNVTVKLQDAQQQWHPPYELGPLPLTSTSIYTRTIPASQLPAAPIIAGFITIAFANDVTTTDTLLVL